MLTWVIAAQIPEVYIYGYLVKTSIRGGCAGLQIIKEV